MKVRYIEDLHTWENEFSFFNKVKVRFSETDLFGHMNNTVPFAYFEEARIEFFKHLGFMQTWVEQGSDAIPVVADLQCDFLKQVFFDEILKIYVKVQTIGKTSIDIHYMAKKEDGSICFVGRGTIVQMSKHTGKGVPWSDYMMEQLVLKNRVPR